MPTLASGDYLVRTKRRVIVWPEPDHQGDGAPVYEEQYSHDGRNMGRKIAKDIHGRVLKHYRAPEGFRDVRGYDGTENYVLHDEFGQIYRCPNGEAVPLREGQAVIFAPDGSVEYLDDDFAQYQFGEIHDAVDSDGNVVEANTLQDFTPVVEQTEEEILQARLAEIRAERGE